MKKKAKKNIITNERTRTYIIKGKVVVTYTDFTKNIKKDKEK